MRYCWRMNMMNPAKFRPLHGAFAIAVVSLLATLPSAHAAERRVGLTSFERLMVEGDLVVEVVPDRVIAARISGDVDAIERIIFDASGGTLTIRNRQTGFEKKAVDLNRQPLVIRLSANNLRTVSLTGAGLLTVDKLGGRKAEVSLRGPGRIIVKSLVADNAQVAMIGSGEMTLGGVVKSLNILTSGAGSLDARALPVADLVVSSEGSGELSLTASKQARVTARGIGTVTVEGKAACTVTNVGSGQVRCGSAKPVR